MIGESTTSIPSKSIRENHDIGIILYSANIDLPLLRNLHT